KLVRLALWDTAGAFEYNRLEPLKHPDSHAILISFAVDALWSFENLEEKARLAI
ncbi:RhoC-like protein, partial [Thelonectria olida]